MKIIHENPYRITGILSNTTEKELHKQKSKITKFANIGKQVKSEFDFPFLKDINRSEDTIHKAFSRIEQNQDKVNLSLFWFINYNSFDETALKYLMNGDVTKAIEIWEKVTNNKEITSKNFSSFNNIGTIKLLGNKKEEIKEGIEAKIRLIYSKHFVDYVKLITDETYLPDYEKQIEIFLDEIIRQVNGKYSTLETFNLFSSCNGIIKQYLSQRFTEEPVQKIELIIENTKTNRKKIPSKGNDFGISLFNETKNDLAILNILLGKNDLKYKMISDNLAKEIMQCSIDYFNEWKDQKNPSDESIKLLNFAQSIANGSQINERIKENIKGINEYAKLEPIKKDIDFITHSLEQFQNLPNTVENASKLITSCKVKLITIKNALGENNELYLNLSCAVVGNAQSMLVVCVNHAQSSLQLRMLQFDSLLTMLKKVVEEALHVSYLLNRLDMTHELSVHCKNNLNSLKSIARQLKVSTLSPEEKIENQIKEYQREISIIKDTRFLENELNSAINRMNEIKEWQLFRSLETREEQIDNQNMIIDNIKNKANSLKRDKIRELENKINFAKKKLENLKK